MVQSRPPSPIKQTFKKLLSPGKQKPAPVLSLQQEQPLNWKYAESTSSSNYSSSSTEGYSGWNVADRPRTPISDPNKENIQSTPKDIVAQIMGRGPSKLDKRNTKSLALLKPQDADLDTQFEELMNSRSIPNELRCKLRSVDASVKKQMLKNHSSLSHSPNKSPSKLFRYGSNADLQSPKKAKKYNTVTPRPSPTKAHPAAIFTESKVWDMEMQSVSEVMEYFGRMKVADIDVGMVKKLWQLLRNESMMWIEEFLRCGGFELIVGVLKQVLGIEWRNEKDDAVLHQILLCLKALSTTEAGLRQLAASSATLFPLLINNLFSDKQPAEFSTRLLIPTLILAHLTVNPSSARTILSYLTDPPPEKPPHDFLLESYIPRPYKKWHAEISSICRDTFWIFLHPRNVIPISSPQDDPFPLSARVVAPVPSGFKGGVEWYATEYVTSHIALINCVVGGLAPRERAVVRRDMRNCGFEGLMGGKLRKSSREYYPGLHKELQRWCCMGHCDGWSVFDVSRGSGGTEDMPVAEKVRTEDEELEFGVDEFEVPGGV